MPEVNDVTTAPEVADVKLLKENEIVASVTSVSMSCDNDDAGCEVDTGARKEVAQTGESEINEAKVSEAKVGELACQKDSFLKSMETCVVACEANDGGKYFVRFQDTVLFPVGGGQPCDHGTVEILKSGESSMGVSSAGPVPGRVFRVENVVRRGLEALHEIDEALPINARVRITVDWERRYDHMQQHTGQHLLSAILDRKVLPTLSWNMAPCEEAVNYIEVTKAIPPKKVAAIQSVVNDIIQRGCGVHVRVVDPKDMDTSRVPDDYDTETGTLRLVCIDGIDENLCCGTHLDNISQIGSIVLLYQTPGKGGNSRLHFTAGNRVTRLLTKYDFDLREMNKTLGCRVSEVGEKVQNLTLAVKKANSTIKSLMQELAQRDLEIIHAAIGTQKRRCIRKTDNNVDYFTAITKGLKIPTDSEFTFLLLNGEKENASIYVAGSEAQVVAAKVEELVANVKGGGKGGKWQAKVTKYNKSELTALEKWFLA
ncbi:putative alanyl-tRNA synthetase [Gregarina niphandrodes]|uniref:Alanyl-tRNA synthetase n=1 Tax=Gregarina niphandrodes TaxID=110365 RepID=A0A023BD18_GRENI|nr:putative alanyl-tRNA synthetase [Gregarina niphandrodes]EZG85836.1 putative alanyl-tRNA synthetase [Gregarina niphandrodes]|eukprot:XP_011128813.1 putative alanyl-tRNA synthetase [Gregarina niphandrodes]